jgi:hypothetical protein
MDWYELAAACIGGVILTNIVGFMAMLIVSPFLSTSR